MAEYMRPLLVSLVSVTLNVESDKINAFSGCANKSSLRPVLSNDLSLLSCVHMESVKGRALEGQASPRGVAK